jgi:hypothetical protein
MVTFYQLTGKLCLLSFTSFDARLRQREPLKIINSAAMANSLRLLRTFSRLLLPIVLLVVAAVAASAVWLVYTVARPVSARYLVTPTKYGQLSTRAAQVTDENWTNRDGTAARGWLLPGAEGAPAVILLHKYGADRSHVLNLGVKLNESTDFTVLMPDLRGHGEQPVVKNASFGGCEAEDTGSAIEFLRALTTAHGKKLVGKSIGIYGVEMGAIAAIAAAARDKDIKAIALDSVPADSDGIVRESVERRFPFASSATTKLAKMGTYMYYFDGCYQRKTVCSLAKEVEGRNVLLLAGVDAPEFQDSTTKLNRCFAGSNKVEMKADLSPSGFSIVKASLEQSEAYDQRLIDHFRTSLAN